MPAFEFMREVEVVLTSREYEVITADTEEEAEQYVQQLGANNQSLPDYSDYDVDSFRIDEYDKIGEVEL